MKSLLLFVFATLLGFLVMWLAFCSVTGCLAALLSAVRAAKAKRYAEAIGLSVPFALAVVGVAVFIVWFHA